MNDNGSADLFFDRLVYPEHKPAHLDKGKAVNSIEMMDVVTRGLNPYAQFEAYIKLAEDPEIRFVISNTTEAGIAFDPACKLDDRPAGSYPGKLTQLLYHRFKTFHGAMDKGLRMILIKAGSLISTAVRN